MVRLDDTPFAPLAAHLLDLVHAVEGADVPLIIVGGFGLILRREWISQKEERTLYGSLPSIWTTEDLDLLLQLEAFADVMRMSALRSALDALGYKVVIGAENYQFFLENNGDETRRNVKIDLLARQPEAEDPPLVIKGRRIMPRKEKNPLHAHVTPEAFAAEEMAQQITLSGTLTDGQRYQGNILLPHPYAVYLMKLFAFRDYETGIKGANSEKDARKHARDLYRVTELLTPTEYSELAVLQAKYQNHPIAQEAARIVRDLFSDPVKGGAARIREIGGAERLPDFLALLTETFPDADSGS